LSADTVAYIRDWVIIIFGVAATAAAITVLVVTLVLYKKVNAIISAVLATARGIRDFSRQVAEQLGGLVPILGIFGRRRRGRDEEEEVRETREEDGGRRRETYERRRETHQPSDGRSG
jgi:hypothetical protein